MTLPSRYGVSLGPYRPIPKEFDSIDLAGELGIHTERSPLGLKEGESPRHFFTNVDMPRLNGGLEPTDGQTQLAGVLPDQAYHLTSFVNAVGLKFAVAIRATKWSYWSGAWAEALGATSQVWDDNLYAIAAQGKLVVAAAPTDRLKSWDGVAANPIQDLSGDAPKAKFIAMIGNRMVAAGITASDGSRDPNLLMWSTDGDITNWTNEDLGAGIIVLLPESGDFSSDPIVGLSTVAAGLLVYRQNSIVLASRTGVGSQPFRFTTIVQGIGPAIGGSPGLPFGSRISKIAHAGPLIGDIFVGNDLNVYLINPPNPPVPVGEPIRKILTSLRQTFSAPIRAVYNGASQEYILSGLGGLGYALDVAQLLTTRRVVWRAVGSSLSNLTALGYNDLSDIAAGLLIGPLLAQSPNGTTVFNLQRPEDLPTVPTQCSWFSRLLGDPSQYVTVGRVHVPYELYRDKDGNFQAGVGVTLYISTDGGANWTSLGTLFTAGGGVRIGELQFPVNLRLATWQFRLEFSGRVRIPRIAWYYDRRGRS